MASGKSAYGKSTPSCSGEPLCQSQIPEPAPLDPIQEDLLFWGAAGPRKQNDAKLACLTPSAHTAYWVTTARPTGGWGVPRRYLTCAHNQPAITQFICFRLLPHSDQSLKACPLLIPRSPSGHCPNVLELSKCPGGEESAQDLPT